MTPTFQAFALCIMGLVGVAIFPLFLVCLVAAIATGYPLYLLIVVAMRVAGK